MTGPKAMEAIKDFVKSFMLIELLKGLRLTGSQLFARKITIQFPEEKTPLSPRFRGLHAPASCVRPCAPRWRSPSSPMCGRRTARGARAATTST
jgi:hypothetical protein